MDLTHDLARPLVLSLVFTIFGVIVFMAAVWLIERITPFSVRKEIEEDHNVALAIVMAALILGVAIILAASLVDFSVVVPPAQAPVTTVVPID